MADMSTEEDWFLKNMPQYFEPQGTEQTAKRALAPETAGEKALSQAGDFASTYLLPVKSAEQLYDLFQRDDFLAALKENPLENLAAAADVLMSVGGPALAATKGVIKGGVKEGVQAAGRVAGADVIAGAGAGIGAESAEALGAGPVGQTIAGLAGGFAGGLSASKKQAMRESLPAGDLAKLQAFEQSTGVKPTPGLQRALLSETVDDTSGVINFERVNERSGELQRVVKGQREGVAEKLAEIKSKIEGSAEGLNAEASVGKLSEGIAQKLKGAEEGMDQLDELISATSKDPRPQLGVDLKKKLEGVLREKGFIVSKGKIKAKGIERGLDDSAIPTLEKWLGRASNVTTLEEMREFRRNFGKAIERDFEIKSLASVTKSDVYRAINDQFVDTAKALGHSDLADQYKPLNEAFSKMAKKEVRDVVDLLDKAPEDALRFISGKAKTDVNGLLKKFEAAGVEKSKIGSIVFEKIAEDAIKKGGKATGSELERLVSTMNSFAKDTSALGSKGELLFGSALKDIREFNKGADAVLRYAKYKSNPSGTSDQSLKVMSDLAKSLAGMKLGGPIRNFVNRAISEPMAETAARELDANTIRKFLKDNDKTINKGMALHLGTALKKALKASPRVTREAMETERETGEQILRDFGGSNERR